MTGGVSGQLENALGVATRIHLVRSDRCTSVASRTPSRILTMCVEMDIRTLPREQVRGWFEPLNVGLHKPVATPGATYRSLTTPALRLSIYSIEPQRRANTGDAITRRR